MELHKQVSFLANLVLIVSVLFNLNAMLGYSYIFATIATILFGYYGYLVKDLSFSISNLIFIFLNLYGIFKWS